MKIEKLDAYRMEDTALSRLELNNYGSYKRIASTWYSDDPDGFLNYVPPKWAKELERVFRYPNRPENTLVMTDERFTRLNC